MTSPIILPAPSLISTASYVRPLNYMSIPSITKSGPIRYQTCYRQPKQQVELSRKVDVNQLNHVVWTSRILTTLYWHKKKNTHTHARRDSHAQLSIIDSPTNWVIDLCWERKGRDVGGMIYIDDSLRHYVRIRYRNILSQSIVSYTWK